MKKLTLSTLLISMLFLLSCYSNSDMEQLASHLKVVDTVSISENSMGTILGYTVIVTDDKNQTFSASMSSNGKITQIHRKLNNITINNSK